MTCRLNLSPDELKLLQSDRDLGEKVFARSHQFDGKEEQTYTLKELLARTKPFVSYDLADQTDFEQSVKEAGGALKGYFERMQQVRSGGPTTEEF